jgi:lipid-A-disaccharide synthase-like uncharacterized protein
MGNESVICLVGLGMFSRHCVGQYTRTHAQIYDTIRVVFCYISTTTGSTLISVFLYGLHTYSTVTIIFSATAFGKLTNIYIKPCYVLVVSLN